jgi:hypothetical protein
VHVAQALFEPQHRLAVTGEPEVPWFYDAGMNRANEKLVQVFALDRRERVRSGIATANKLGARIPAIRPAPAGKGRAWHAPAGWPAQRTRPIDGKRQLCNRSRIAAPRRAAELAWIKRDLGRLSR